MLIVQKKSKSQGRWRGPVGRHFVEDLQGARMKVVKCWTWSDTKQSSPKPGFSEKGAASRKTLMHSFFLVVAEGETVILLQT